MCLHIYFNLQIPEQVKVKIAPKKLKKGEARTKKPDPEMELEGNQKLNRLKKMQFKKEKKERNRREKVATQLAVGLESFTLNKNDDYQFEVDFGKK